MCSISVQTVGDHTEIVHAKERSIWNNIREDVAERLMTTMDENATDVIVIIDGTTTNIKAIQQEIRLQMNMEQLATRNEPVYHTRRRSKPRKTTGSYRKRRHE